MMIMYHCMTLDRYGLNKEDMEKQLDFHDISEFSHCYGSTLVQIQFGGRYHRSWGCCRHCRVFTWMIIS